MYLDQFHVFLFLLCKEIPDPSRQSACVNRYQKMMYRMADYCPPLKLKGNKYEKCLGKYLEYHCEASQTKKESDMCHNIQHETNKGG